MPISRRCGGSAVMLVPSSRMSPADGGTKPAIMRSVVVLPQPDGTEQHDQFAGARRRG